MLLIVAWAEGVRRRETLLGSSSVCWASLDSSGDHSLFLRLPRLSINCYIIVTLFAIVSYCIHGSLDQAAPSLQSLPHQHLQNWVWVVFFVRLVANTHLLRKAYDTPTHTPYHDGAFNGPHDTPKTGRRKVWSRYPRGTAIQRLR